MAAERDARTGGLRIGSLFAGIGGLEMGLERAGVGHTVWQVEQSEWCRNVLARHWPQAERYDDVRTVGAANLAPMDVLCGGFPCQDISTAGKGAGLSGARSGLWFEYLRIIRELKPLAVVAENVAALRNRGLDVVRAGMRDAGYRVVVCGVSAADVGAPHRRERVFVVATRIDVADALRERREVLPDAGLMASGCVEAFDERDPEAVPVGYGSLGPCIGRDMAAVHAGRRDGGGREVAAVDVADSVRERGAGRGAPRDMACEARGAEGDVRERQRRGHAADDSGADEQFVQVAVACMGRASDGLSGRLDGMPAGIADFVAVVRAKYAGTWPSAPCEPQHGWEPPRTLGGKAKDRAQRLKALGNAVVPQCAEAVGLFLMDQLR